MELLADSVTARGKSFADNAFMTGILSLLDALLGKPLDELIVQLDMPPGVSIALTDKSGKLGDMLTLAETRESGEADTPAVCYFRLGGLGKGRVTAAHVEALRWASNPGSETP